MERKPCAACSRKFRPRPQTPNQAYCPGELCQRERRRLWQKAKRHTDPDYRANQAKAQRTWCQSNPGYWRDYRLAHPEYVSRNRAQQSERNERRNGLAIAKMDASASEKLFPPGVYRLVPLAPAIAKMDACTVEITVLSSRSTSEADCKETT
jgi:hypothetical protein